MAIVQERRLVALTVRYDAHAIIEAAYATLTLDGDTGAELAERSMFRTTFAAIGGQGDAIDVGQLPAEVADVARAVWTPSVVDAMRAAITAAGIVDAQETKP